MGQSINQTGQNAPADEYGQEYAAKRVRFVDESQAWAMSILDTPDAAKTSRDQARQLILTGEVLGTLHVLLAQNTALIQMLTPLVQQAGAMLDSPAGKLVRATGLGRRRA